MDFSYTPEQLEFKQRINNFARDVMRPVAQKHDREQSVPWDVMKAAAKEGIGTLDFMMKLGDDPQGMFSPIYAEEMHWGCAGIALAVAGSGLAAAGIAASGTGEQIAEWVPLCFASGDDVHLGAYAVTEPSAGSDVKSLKTTAKLDGDEWVLNGTKVFITNGGIADVTVVVASVDPELGTRGQASFIIPKGTPGFSQGKKEDKLGIRASQTTEVVMDDCRIPTEFLLGGMDKLNNKLEKARSGQKVGGANALATFEMTRPFVGASAIGIARAAYEFTVEYLMDKKIGGKPALENPGVHQQIADLATEIDAARLLVQRAAWMARNGIPLIGGQGSMSKLKCGDVAMWATARCMDLVGPEAWSTELPLEKWYRDAKIYQIFEGTSQIQRMVIGRLQVGEFKARLEAAKAEFAEASGQKTTAEPVPA
ncbi:MAG: acyl-CoA dehydrogenase family protein [Solirubrobacterales bacterium]